MCPPRQLRRKSPPLHLHPHFGCSWVNGGDCNVIAELAKGARQNPGALFLSLRVRLDALLDESNPLMQDLPDHAAESMCDCPDGRLIDSPVAVADAGTPPESGCRSSSPQRAPPGSALAADIYCLSQSDCCGSLRHFRPFPDRFPPKK